MNTPLPTLSSAGLQRFLGLRRDAVDSVAERFYAEHGGIYAAFGPRGRDACREDLGFHLEFLQPVLEFGLLDPIVDYLRWLGSVLATRGIPVSHVPQSLDWLAEFFAERMDAADAQIVIAVLRQAKEKSQQTAEFASGIEAKAPEAWPECSAFEQALLAGDRREAIAIVERCLVDGRDLIAAELHIIQPALYRIGRKWQNNEVSVAQEHLATAIAQSVMSLGLMKTEPASPIGKRVLLACVEGNRHAVGLQMVADAYQLSGWDVQFLGADVPTAALVGQVLEWKPHLVGLSISFAHQLPVVRKVMVRLQEALGNARPPVIIGGLAINHFDALAGQVGAEGWGPDAAAAVASGTVLAGGQ